LTDRIDALIGELDVVVVNYRTNDDLTRFIDSYREYAPDFATLTVVDVDPVSPYGRTNVPGNYLVMPDNLGYSGACNLASTYLDGEVLSLFNADIILEPRVLEDCFFALVAEPDWGALGPLQYDTKGQVTHGGVLGTNKAPYQRGWHKRLTDEYRDVQEDAVMVIGSAYFIKRSVWDELTDCPIYQAEFPGVEGAFLPTPLYYEETGCSYHLAAHGYKNVYYGKASCVHKWHGSIHKHGDRGAFPISRDLFRSFCDAHEIEHD
jgi:GT2 family glycosyltransferase